MARSAITVRLEGAEDVFGKQRKRLSPLMQPGMVSMIDGAVKRSFARDFRDEGHHEPPPRERSRIRRDRTILPPTAATERRSHIP